MEETVKAYPVASAELLLSKHFPILVRLSLSDLLHTMPSSSYQSGNLTPDLVIAWQMQ